jgi:mono/diheme cytochrome c family protein
MATAMLARRTMKIFTISSIAWLPLLVCDAFAGDAAAGKRLAQLRCAACHIVVPNQRGDVADAPPFDVVARKFEGNADLLVANLMGPHAKVNFGLPRREAVDIAEYIRSLGR